VTIGLPSELGIAIESGLVLASFGENPRLLGGLLKTAQRALDRLARCDANFH